jgi:hypothetical protein
MCASMTTTTWRVSARSSSVCQTASGKSICPNAQVTKFWNLKRTVLFYIFFTYLIVITEKKCSLDPVEYSKKFYNIFTSNPSHSNYFYTIHVVIRIVCQPGYELIGSAQLTCKSNAQKADWNYPPPVCRPGNYTYFFTKIEIRQ